MLKCNLDHLIIDVYERLVPKGGKAGFAQLLVTQVVSAVWHVSFLHPLLCCCLSVPFHVLDILVAEG